uniref:Uncharacterized protein n=1 Tax=Avena sativa TaxID=4498 RepID=A0ACD5UIS7_AVESA
METSTALRRSARRKPERTLTEISDHPVAEIPDRPVLEIPDHLVAEIFLRLSTAEDLVRASASCVSFRRLVIDKSFLRRFRRLHDPPVLAFFDRDGFHHALPPHRSAPVASALASAADFSFSFLPNHLDWVVQDIRDGRVLLLRPGEGQKPQVSMELAVCDPLHRGYVLLPPVPDDLVASEARAATEYMPWCEPFLVPTDEEAEEAFGVIWMVHFHTRLVAALVFSSSTGQWQAAASKEWTMVSPIVHEYQKRHYAYGCFYWESSDIHKKEFLVFDTRSLEFSISDLPPREWCPRGLAIVEAGEGRIGLVGILDETLAGKLDLCYYIKGNKGESSGKWQLDKTISLGSDRPHYIKAAAGTYLLLVKFGDMQFVGLTRQRLDFEIEYILVDVKTLQLERLCSKSSGFAFSKTLQLERLCSKSSGFAFSKTWIYTNFPPSLSSPTV